MCVCASNRIGREMRATEIPPPLPTHTRTFDMQDAAGASEINARSLLSTLSSSYAVCGARYVRHVKRDTRTGRWFGCMLACASARARLLHAHDAAAAAACAQSCAQYVCEILCGCEMLKML